MGIRGDRVGMATKAALEPSQLETHITSLMRASFGCLKVNEALFTEACAQMWPAEPAENLLVTGCHSKSHAVQMLQGEWQWMHL